MNHPKSMFQLSGIHYNSNNNGVWRLVMFCQIARLRAPSSGVAVLGSRVQVQGIWDLGSRVSATPIQSKYHHRRP